MENKKIFLLGASLIIIIILAVYIVTRGQGTQKTVPTNISGTPGQSTPAGQPSYGQPSVPQLPTSTTETNQSGTLDQNQISGQFNSFARKDTSTVQSMEILSGSSALPIDQTFSALKFYIPVSLTGILFSNDYQFFSCPSESGQKGYGLYLNFDAPEKEISNRVRIWEGRMLNDLHSVLFPGMEFSSQYLAKPLVFQGEETRSAEIMLPNSSKTSLLYKINLQTLFIASSQECLGKGSDALFDP